MKIYLEFFDQLIVLNGNKFTKVVPFLNKILLTKCII